jgi:hypothetical protein
MPRRAATTVAHGVVPRANPASDTRTCNIPWSAKEDAALVKAKRRLGTNWKEIAKLLPGRTARTVKQHWYGHLKPQLDAAGIDYQPPKGSAWIAEDDDNLVNAQRRLGNHWTAMVKLLPGRTAGGIKERWCRHLKTQLDADIDNQPPQNSQQQRSAAASADTGKRTSARSRRRA